MKITLKENKYGFFKRFKKTKTTLINRKKGENILLIGDDFYSGKGAVLLNCFELLFKNGYMDNHSIVMDMRHNSGLFQEWISIINNYSEKAITSNDFNLFNALNDSIYFSYHLNFKSKSLQNLINKHTLFLISCFERNRQEINNQFYDFLENLPINDKEEIPIMISDKDLMDKSDTKRFIGLVKELNKKGYFVIYSMRDLKEYFETSLEILKDAFKHMLILKSDVKNEVLPKKLKHIKPELISVGECYYVKNFELINKNPQKFPFFERELLKKLPTPKNLKKLLILNKIKKF